MKYLWLSFLCVLLLGASYSSGSKSFSKSSSRSYSSNPSKSFSSKPKPSRSKPFFSSKPSPSFSSKPSPNPSIPTKSFDSKASAAQKVSESRQAMELVKARNASPSRPSHSASPSVRANASASTSPTSFQRPSSSSSQSVPAHTVEQSPDYSPLFWAWLMQRSADERAAYAYNHRNNMDRKRYNELLKKDAELEKKIKELEAKNVIPDPNYQPQDYEEKKKDEPIHPAWWLLLLIPIGLGIFFVWRVA